MLGPILHANQPGLMVWYLFRMCHLRPGTDQLNAARGQAHSPNTLKVCRQWCRPYQSGEVIVQNYNSLLTLAHLAEVSDGIMLVENSALHSTCQRLLNIPRPSFTVRPGMACKLTCQVACTEVCGDGISACCLSCRLWHLSLHCACFNVNLA